MTGRRAVAFALLLVAPLLLVAGPAPAAASDPPPATPFCERPLSRALTDADVDATLTSVTARAAVDDTARGTAADWTVNATFAERSTVKRLLGNLTLRRRVVANASTTVPPADVTVVAAGPKTLSFRFHTDDFAAGAPGGLLRVDYFHVRGSSFRSVSCDSVAVVAPENYTLATRPAADGLRVSADGERVVLRGDGAEWSGAFLVFAPDGTPAVLRGALARLALGLAVAGTVLGNAALLVCLPGAVLAGCLTVVHQVLDALVRPHQRVHAGEVGLTLLVLAVVGAVPLVWLLGLWEAAFAVSFVGIVVGGVLAAVGEAGPNAGSESFFPVVVGVAAAGVVAAAGALLGVVPANRAAAATFLLVPVLGGCPLGVAAAAGRSARGSVAVAVAGVVAAAVAYFYPLTAAGSTAVPVLVVLVPLAAGGVAVAAVPFALVGVGSVRG